METPNLLYIKSLSGGETEFEEKLISIIKNEFPNEKSIYYEHLKAKNYIKAADDVHKLKHKISILGLENSYNLAVDYENNLRENRLNLQNDFENVLQIITEYLSTL
ncbi:MAG: Hpt domain-containing protein [Flavobacteriaceae bacterium]|nr:Hpt domain-containing protein [Flavobacteriaceae bacterium]